MLHICHILFCILHISLFAVSVCYNAKLSLNGFVMSDNYADASGNISKAKLNLTKKGTEGDQV